MSGEILTVEQLRPYLGIDNEHDEELAQIRASAIEYICRATEIDWTQRSDVGTFNEALRVQAWISYYAVRDESKNTEFLLRYLSGRICSLQLSKSGRVAP